MRLFKTLGVLWLISAAAGVLAAQSMPTYWRLADPDAKMLMGMNLKGLMDSQMAAEWKSQFAEATKGAPAGSIPLSLDMLNPSGEIGKFLNSVDRVFVSMGEIPQGAKAKPRLSVAITGEFDLASVRKFLGQQGGVKSVFRGVEVWQSKGTDNAMIAIVNPQLLAVGDKASVRRAVSQFAVGDGSIMGTPVYQHASELAKDNDFWIAGEIPAPTAKELESNPMAAQFLKSVQSFDLGMRMRSGLDFEANLYTDTPEAAQGLTAAMSAMMQLASLDKQNKEVAELLGRVRMGAEGQQVQIAASWTSAELQVIAKARMNGPDLAASLPPGTYSGSATTSGRLNPGSAGAPRPLAGTAVSLPAAVSRPAEPPKPLKVRIYNPDADGVREFELKRE